MTEDARYKSRPHRFLGMNIKGTPKMTSKQVTHDLELAKTMSDVLVVQEFKWRWYWGAAKKLLARSKWANTWRSSPSYARGMSQPGFGAQGVMWKAKSWKRIRTKTKVLNAVVPGTISKRWLRAVLLEDRETGQKCWFGTTHFVVAGDMNHDRPTERVLMQQHLKRFDAFLEDLTKTGHPVLFQLDANLTPKSDVWDQFMVILLRHGAAMHGVRGVEYLFSISGKEVRVQVEQRWTIPARKLMTDHEGRGVTYRLVCNSYAAARGHH